ncbi:MULTISPECIES: threonine--tRNA ligase [Streptomyces]|uniref:Threonine--tRNA ligase n=2 Tax=Streptomyces rimosus subsp. rimosus TaxID=132474 RepID=L8EIV3_STRR1|nr:MULTISPECIES: threonine--tRNA ligase [Streptomyces]KOG72628.1 threonine--tRNA ligase [Kitasatospora aureofaciens]MYT43208.1 threonine--tRNA ligase [Streptomyces sp. SID5471]KEF07009.1 threonine--tRNA ligase [Streptomyces rimosus]KUJ30062.1 threonine--tRNA ligase [Streptomyces rimosus subsp. rimosus]QDA08018.1 threonine--tRNA ligase [Streptomyces rimosus]
MSDVRVTIQRDSEREERVVTTGTTAADLFQGERSVVAARVAGQLKDLAYELAEGDEVEPVEITSQDGLDILRHSTAHVMAQAVQELFPEAKLGIGPPIKDGFYYDFDVETPFTPEDLKRIEKKMQEIQKRGQKFARRPVSDDDARAELAGEPYKLELIGLKGSAAEAAEGASAEVGAGELTIYDNLDAKSGELCWKDLCRGPHLPSTRVIPAFKLMRSAAAYWRGSEKNKQLQRIYGTAWPTKDELKAYLEFLAEAEKRDHRKLGAELDLFSIPEELGSGLAVFHPKGGIIRREMENYSRRRHEDADYEFVNTPHISKEGLFETSGHLPNYAEAMFPPLEFDGQNYRLKAMNCPMHNLIFKARGRSYRELPLRLFEFGTVYRYEKSGVVHGLTRARGFTQDDSHIYCTKEQMADELDSLLTFVLDLLRDYGLNDFELELSTRDPESDKFIGEDAEWEEATEALRQAAEKQGLPLVPDPGGAAYYGPKISVQARDAIGRSWQMSTIQVDFQQPKRFGLEYTAADGSKQQPVMIHRALFGSIERFFAVLLEHYAGAFPVWLAPVQATGIPIGDDHVPYLQEFAAEAKKAGLRVEVDSSADRMQKKIRNAQKSKVPFMIIAGDEDVSNGAVSFRYRDGSQKNGIPKAQAIQEMLDAVERRVQV